MRSVALGSVSADVGSIWKCEAKKLIRKRRDCSLLRVRGSVAPSPQSLRVVTARVQKSEEIVRIGVLGASGYTGSEGEEFVRLLEKEAVPHTRNVRGSNYCFMNVFQDRIPGRAIIISVIDNLVKGASGQAIRNLNLMMGFPENKGLQHQPLFP